MLQVGGTGYAVIALGGGEGRGVGGRRTGGDRYAGITVRAGQLCY